MFESMRSRAQRKKTKQDWQLEIQLWWRWWTWKSTPTSLCNAIGGSRWRGQSPPPQTFVSGELFLMYCRQFIKILDRIELWRGGSSDTFKHPFKCDHSFLLSPTANVHLLFTIDSKLKSVIPSPLIGYHVFE